MAAKYEMLNPVKICLEKCVFDDDNPNEMSEEQDVSLDNSLHEFGYLGDLIVVNPADKHGNHLVHHGEHRIKKLLNNNMKWAWGFIKRMSLLKHKAYRQAMNKLHGEHDPEKDKAELLFFAEKNKLDFLSQLIAQPKEQLMFTDANLESLVVGKDRDMIPHYAETFLTGNLKQLIIMFDNKGFEKIMPKIEKLYKQFKVDNNTDLFVKMVDFCLKKKEKK